MQLHSYREAHVVSTQTANEIVKDKRTSNLANQNRLMDFTPNSRPAKFLPEKTKDEVTAVVFFTITRR